ncbi:TauD/TfdA dioxygenase family protein [Paraburkholderia xenovorans]|uniref:TauD/TfdA dioxygenase family protein n=1 Tax=Paraburkholderia xenovorans TaxID=36873 RepID=UPI001559693A|nr:TauD/TfdA family dioxygenase [Paraburkholderia xenovorans]NPT38734.1 TauD/TfdA family dioxygenase [Paraburkholderia xenovorans]
MSLNVEAAHPFIAARIHGLDLSKPLSDERIVEIEQASGQYPVLIFPRQYIDDDQLLAFAAGFGPLQVAVSYSTRPEDHRLAPMINDISNLSKENQTYRPGDRRRMNNLTSRRWHSDASYLPLPARYSFLLSYIVPAVGGQTQFADMRAAYDKLPDHLRKVVEGLSCHYDIMASRAAAGFYDASDEERKALAPCIHELVRTHPISGRKSLYLSSHATHVVGWPEPEGRDLLRELTEFATQPQFVYSHEWSVRDLVMWDNRALMHRGRPHIPETDVREMHRATTLDDRTWTRGSNQAVAASVA